MRFLHEKIIFGQLGGGGAVDKFNEWAGKYQFGKNNC